MSPRNSTPVPVYWSEQAWWWRLHQVSNPRPRLRCWETAKTHGSAILWSSASDESCEGAITACLRETELTGPLTSHAYMTRSGFHFILHNTVSLEVFSLGFRLQPLLEESRVWIMFPPIFCRWKYIYTHTHWVTNDVQLNSFCRVVVNINAKIYTFDKR